MEAHTTLITEGGNNSHAQNLGDLISKFLNNCKNIKEARVTNTTNTGDTQNKWYTSTKQCPGFQGHQRPTPTLPLRTVKVLVPTHT